MRLLWRPGLWAVALALAIAFAIGGPMHTSELLPADEPIASDDSTVIVRSDAESLGAGDPTDGAIAASHADEPVVMASADGQAWDAADAVGGPTESEAEIEIAMRPTISYYTVKPGETLSDIALRFRISTQTIIAANDLANANLVRAGQQLKILSQDGAIHQVKSGENLWEIAQTYRTTIDEIVSVNELSNPNRIRPAQELVIPGVQAAQIGSALRSERLVSADGRLLRAFDWPVRGRISSNYGMRWDRMHHGMDIAVNTGTPVRAAASGRVTFSGMNGGYGYLVTIDHGDGVETRYAHNSRLLVRVGEYVDRGQVIAHSGNTGNSTGPHVHFEIRLRGQSLDPRNYLK